MPTIESKEIQPFHFFASSVCTWRTRASIQEIIKLMTKEGYSFNLWYVPIPESSTYKINGYAPIVDGAIYLGMFTGKKG